MDSMNNAKRGCLNSARNGLPCQSACEADEKIAKLEHHYDVISKSRNHWVKQHEKAEEEVLRLSTEVRLASDRERKAFFDGFSAARKTNPDGSNYHHTAIAAHGARVSDRPAPQSKSQEKRFAAQGVDDARPERCLAPETCHLNAGCCFGCEDAQAPVSEEEAAEIDAAVDSQPHAWVNQGICCRQCATPWEVMSTFIVCPYCGDKRCPRAEDCDAQCATAATSQEEDDPG